MIIAIGPEFANDDKVEDQKDCHGDAHSDNLDEPRSILESQATDRQYVIPYFTLSPGSSACECSETSRVCLYGREPSLLNFGSGNM